MVVFLRIRPGQVPKEPQPEGLDPFRDWQAACSVPNRLICSVSGVRDPKDFPQTPGVKGIKAFIVLLLMLLFRVRTILVLGYWVLGNICRYWIVLLVGDIFFSSWT